MTRVVQGDDGRRWTVQSRINWSQPATAEQFEHDMAEGYVSGIVMLVVVVALVLFVLFWTPTGAVEPWLLLLFLLVLMFLPMGWAIRRPWTIEAKTLPEPVGTTAERWVGTAHGPMAAREVTHQVIQNLKSSRALPDDGTGLLRPVT